MTGWDVLTGQASVPPGMLAELPGYDVILTSRSPSCRFEAIRRDPVAGTWCLISAEPAGLWRELAPCAPGRTPLILTA